MKIGFCDFDFADGARAVIITSIARPREKVPFRQYLLIRVSVGKSSKKREHDNQKVQGQGPVPDIIKIVFDTLLN